MVPKKVPWKGMKQRVDKMFFREAFTIKVNLILNFQVSIVGSFFIEGKEITRGRIRSTSCIMD